MVPTTTTIRDELAMYLSQKGMSINQFSGQSGINSGTLSRILNDQQPIAMDHLVRITKAMELPEDHFYSLYVEECFYHSSPTWRRLRPFLVHSAALGRLDCVEQVVQNLLENLIYAPMLFEVAEGLFQEGLWEAAELLYKNVSVSEKYQNSERLAICQFRLFRIALGDDQTKNLQAALLFECYLDRLDEADQLDGLNHLINVYYSLHKWKKVDDLAQELFQLASLRYDLHHNSKRTQNSPKNPEKPLYRYILYSHLMRASVYEEQKDYKTAQKFVSLYMDSSWIREDDENAKRTVAQYQEWGNANTILYRLMLGQHEALLEYVELISLQNDEIFVALFNIVIAANLFNWNIDHILERFAAYLPYRTNLDEFGEYHQQIIADQYARFLSELAAYYLHNKRREGIIFVLQSLALSARINNETNIFKCVDLFEQHRHLTDEEEKEQYKLLIREVQDSHDKKIHQASSFL
ncbi:helix-turn-helix transcriptional regulator [Paenibacillus sp. MMS20-IR301]|uniref:helix-turn-helix domain-containing protein n=1 Tax=Paenibacillus sp. MMS20-IR301 TaxID=2895946 RepID=UPI0028E57A75|nr:helix-turn-helix transcriptional regulator [Paenibacillus sp. MMS20-IR301]WNS43540.1 helix-turn-helix transcriptional regulator [Paenibacillus sp. MMS20-IR301]